jgi:tRNA-dihydrouridine synthase A
MSAYLEREAAQGFAVRATARHMHGLLTGLAGARTWRRVLSDARAIEREGTGLLRAAYAAAGWSEPREASASID